MGNNAQLLPPASALHSRNSGTLIKPRFGVGIHFDDSSNDKSSLAWFTDPDCHVSYNRLYMDNGDVNSIADDDREAWHFGICLPPNDFNHTLYGLAAATNAKIPATQKQFASMCEDTARIFRFHGWPIEQIPVRIIGHDEKAIFNKKDNPTRPDLWGKLGRRIDPTGYNHLDPIINVERMQVIVALLLKGQSADVDQPIPGTRADEMPVLKPGDNSKDVVELQRLLRIAAIGKGVGNFGPMTTAAVIAFQRAHGLKADGIVGRKTWQLLLGE
jgi:hypothetical protein